VQERREEPHVRAEDEARLARAGEPEAKALEPGALRGKAPADLPDETQAKGPGPGGRVELEPPLPNRPRGSRCCPGPRATGRVRW
jgi:hypothetical protein